jgi:hypothetical protein
MTIEEDTSFSAHCPACDGRTWDFVENNLDARQCRLCKYIHYLRGDKQSEIVELPVRSAPPPHHADEFPFSRRDRVRELVIILLKNNNVNVNPNYPVTAKLIVDLAKFIDDELENIKDG